MLDRVPRKSAYLVFSLGLLAGTAACGLALAIVADMFPAERRGHATSMLMLAFAVASVVGVPLGIVLGTRLGWQAPFFALTALGLPLVGFAAWALPPLAAHVVHRPRHPLAHLFETLTVPAHRRGEVVVDADHDRIDSEKIARLLRGGTFSAGTRVSQGDAGHPGPVAAPEPVRPQACRAHRPRAEHVPAVQRADCQRQGPGQAPGGGRRLACARPGPESLARSCRAPPATSDSR